MRGNRHNTLSQLAYRLVTNHAVEFDALLAGLRSINNCFGERLPDAEVNMIALRAWELR